MEEGEEVAIHLEGPRDWRVRSQFCDELNSRRTNVREVWEYEWRAVRVCGEENLHGRAW